MISKIITKFVRVSIKLSLLILFAISLFIIDAHANIFSEDSPLVSSGFIQLRYDGKILSKDDLIVGGINYGKDYQDHKMFQTADFTLSEKSWGHFRFSMSGDFMEDIDDIRSDESDKTGSIHDSFDKRTNGYLYLLQAEVYNLGIVDYFRLGRQYIDYEIPSYVDGLNFVLKYDKINFYAYAGIPVHLYGETEFEDSKQAGGGANMLILPDTKIALEYQYTEEKPAITGSYSEEKTEFFRETAVSIRHSFLDNSYGYFGIVTSDTALQHIEGMASMFFDKMNIGLDVSYLYQIDKIEKKPVTASPISSLTGTIMPYHHATLDISKGMFNDSVTLSCGGELRLLQSKGDESEFNHSYTHDYLAVTIDDFFIKGMNIGLHGDFFKGIGSDNINSIITGGGEIEYKNNQTYNVTLGSYYSLYKYDYYDDVDQVDEKTNVYTIYSKGRYYIYPWLYADARYELNIHYIYEHRITASVSQQL